MQDWHIAITGGSKGIGAATANTLARQAVHLHLMARNQPKLDEFSRSLNAKAYSIDLAKPEQIAHVMRSIGESSGGRLDGLVINAAKYGMSSYQDLTPEMFRAYLDTNLVASLELVRCAAPLLKAGQGKSIVMVSSTLALRPVPGTAAYAASKAGLNNLVRCLALELAAESIRVNAVLPGVVDTEIHDPQRVSDPSRSEKMTQLAPLHPLGRVGTAQDVANMIEFLLSPKSSWMTGSCITVDGGISVA
ncbi:MAG: SDR family oxidoreductase [Acidobacteria bacterium]|nr:SDR family oxidoreductase [Acidobacteriota bacterium]